MRFDSVVRLNARRASIGRTVYGEGRLAGDHRATRNHYSALDNSNNNILPTIESGFLSRAHSIGMEALAERLAARSPGLLASRSPRRRDAAPRKEHLLSADITIHVAIGDELPWAFSYCTVSFATLH